MSATLKNTIDGSSAMHIVPKDTLFLLFLDDDESDNGDDDTDFKSCDSASSSARPPDDSSLFPCSLLDDDGSRMWDFHMSLTRSTFCVLSAADK